MFSKYKVSMEDLREYVVSARSEQEARDMMEVTAESANTEVYSVEKIEAVK